MAETSVKTMLEWNAVVQRSITMALDRLDDAPDSITKAMCGKQLIFALLALGEQAALLRGEKEMVTLDTICLPGGLPIREVVAQHA
jgi:hypothetical protein